MSVETNSASQSGSSSRTLELTVTPQVVTDTDTTITATATAYGDGASSATVTIDGPQDSQNGGTQTVSLECTASEEDGGKELLFVANAPQRPRVERKAYYALPEFQTLKLKGGKTEWRQISATEQGCIVTLKTTGTSSVKPIVPSPGLADSPYEIVFVQWITGSYKITYKPSNPPKPPVGQPAPGKEQLSEQNDTWEKTTQIITSTGNDQPGPYGTFANMNTIQEIEIDVKANIYMMVRPKGSIGEPHTIGKLYWEWKGGFKNGAAYGEVKDATGKASTEAPQAP